MDAGQWPSHRRRAFWAMMASMVALGVAIDRAPSWVVILIVAVAVECGNRVGYAQSRLDVIAKMDAELKKGGF